MVHLDVVVQQVLLLVASAALFARVQLLDPMLDCMILKVRLTLKGLPAMDTPEQPYILTFTIFPILLQIVPLIITPRVSASFGVTCAVCPHVLLQSMLAAERSQAHRALMKTAVEMAPEVKHEIRDALKGITALFTDKGHHDNPS